MNKLCLAVGGLLVLVLGSISCISPETTPPLETTETPSEATVLTLQGKLTASEATVLTLQGKLTASEATVLTLQGKLTASEATISTSEADLGTANAKIEDLEADVSTLQTLNSELTATLIMVGDPRHFSSLTELVDWLYEDDTDTEYAGERITLISYILQIRALRAGYLLPVDFDVDEDGDYYVSNAAVIGDSLYWVYADDDDTEWVAYIQPVPSHPLPLD